MRIYAASYLVPVSSPPIHGGAIAVAEGRIVDAGPLAELRSRHDAPVTDFSGCAIMPGLVNAHSHLELTHFPSWVMRKGVGYSPRTYTDWVIQVIKIRRNVTPEELDLSVREGVRKSVEAGTTSLGEIVTDRSLLPLYAASPLAGRLYFEAIGQDPARFATTEEQLEKTITEESFGRFQAGVSPHAPHTVAADLMERLHRLAQRHGLPKAIHTAESPEESDFFFDAGGRVTELLYPFIRWEDFIPPPRRTTPAAWLESLGVLDPATLLIHCVHCSPADAEIIKRSGASIVLCPRSNDRLAVGKAPAYLFKKLGIPLAIGTDSLASNDSISLWDEMRFLSAEFPGVFSHEELIAMATLGGAQALRIANERGSLETGKIADFLVVKLPSGAGGKGLFEALVEEGRLTGVCASGTSLLGKGNGEGMDERTIPPCTFPSDSDMIEK